MKIGLLDIDGHNFPNLALMKISAYHKSKGDSVEWINFFNEYDIVYQSKVFSFTPDNGFIINAKKIIKGGTGFDPSIKLPNEIEFSNCDYSIYPQTEHAHGFLTRGCIRNCSWCVVPRKEGGIFQYMDIEQVLQDRKSAILMDNNVLASDWGIKQIEKIVKLRIKVDFNQGLDARLIDRTMARLLSKVKWLSPLRMSCDNMTMVKPVKSAMRYLREYDCTPRNYFIYVLIKNIDDAHRRVKLLSKWGLDPFAQPYIDFTGVNKITREQRDFARWVNHKAIFKSVKWEDYNKI